MRSLITGSNGLIGSHLAEKLSKLGDEICLISKKNSTLQKSLIGKFNFKFGDITDSEFMFSTIERFKPERVFHFAAQSFPKLSHEKPHSTLRVNIEGTYNLLSAISENCPNAVVIISGSSSEYGKSLNNEKINENHPLEPNCIYGVSKLADYHISRIFSNTKNLNIIYTRPFFIIGPRKTGDASSDFARAIVKIERKQSKFLSHGNLESIRDFIDIEDCINALIILCNHGNPGEVYNICSGEGTKVNDLLEEFCKISKYNINTVIDKKLYRPVDEIIRIGDPRKLESLGWEKRITLKKSVENILNYWRNKI